MAKTVFTNGCFDIIHAGHVDLLERARALGDRLVVGINSDESVRRIKGADRPFIDQESRRQILLGLRSVDEVIIYDSTTPEQLIRSIMPNVLVKGGDWQPNEIIGADIVIESGGEVHSLPLKGSYSSSGIVRSIREGSGDDIQTRSSENGSLREHIELFERLESVVGDAIKECADLLFETFEKQKKVLVCGNGGSAADAQHLAAELVGRYEIERKAFPAIALTTDTSAITALGNDYGFERIFARQVEALAVEGDCLIAISTSGNSSNVVAAVMMAREKGCRVIGMTGESGKKLAGLCDASIMVPSARTARIQEAHIAIAHIWCEMIDQRLVRTASGSR